MTPKIRVGTTEYIMMRRTESMGAGAFQLGSLIQEMRGFDAPDNEANSRVLPLQRPMI
jgi:hypothetical protein